MAKQERQERRRIGDQGFSPDDLAVLAMYGQRQQEDPRLGMAMQLLKMMEGQRSDVADRAYKERAMEAERMWREGELEDKRKQESRLSAGAEETKRQYEEEKKIREQQRGEDIAHRTEREKIEDTAKAATLTKSQKDEAIDAVDKMVARQIITPDEAKARYEQLDPEFAAMAKGMKAQKDEELFRKNLEQYRKLSPKDRSKLLPETYGGPETFQRIKDAVEGYTYEPGGPSAMPGKIIADWKPQLEPAVSEPPMRVGYGQAAAEPQAYSYATRAPQTVPAVGGMTVPTQAVPAEAVPTETTEDFIRRVQAQPEAFGGGVPLPTSEEITSGIESDPRYRSAEQDVLLAIKDWWNKPSAPREPISAGVSEATPYRYGVGAQGAAEPEFGGPSAMPQQPGFLDNLLRQISEYSASRPTRTPVERYPYPIGHGVPPTAPVDPSLLNPKVMPIGYGR